MSYIPHNKRLPRVYLIHWRIPPCRYDTNFYQEKFQQMRSLRMSWTWLLLYSLACSGSDASIPVSPLLYKVQKDGPCSYLLGTIHLGISSREFPSYVGVLFRQAKVVIVEMKLESINLQSLETSLMLPEGQRLSELLSSESWALLSTALKDKSPQLDRLRPSAALMAYLHRHTEDSMDFELQSTATELNIPLIELETENQQNALMRQFFLPDIKQETASLEQALRNHQMVDEKQRELIEVVRSGEIGRLDTFIDTLVPRSIRSQTLDGRNLAWLPRILEVISDRNTFVVVGAAHLVGESGLIGLFERHGYRVTRVTEHSQ